MGVELQARLLQLTRDGLMEYFDSAQGMQIALFPSHVVGPPKPMIRGYGCAPGFHKKHDGICGVFPESGLYRFSDCYIGKSGTVMNRRRQVLYGDTLISSYWMWFLGKMITKTKEDLRVGQSVIGRFIFGHEETVTEIDVGEATLVCLAKPGATVYGHWILDLLPMTYNFFEALKRGGLVPPFKFLLPAKVPEWARRMLTSLFGIHPGDLIFFDDDLQVLHARQVVVPSLQRVGSIISPRMNEFIAFAFDRLDVDSIVLESQLPKRIFISRQEYSAMDNRALVNQQEVLEAVRASGVSPIMPEKLPWPHQLKLFSTAEVVMGEYGSGLHNTLFSPCSTRSIVMVNLKSNWNQSGIAALRGQELMYIKPAAQERIGGANGVRYSYDPDTLRQAIRECLEYGSGEKA